MLITGILKLCGPVSRNTVGRVVAPIQHAGWCCGPAVGVSGGGWRLEKKHARRSGRSSLSGARRPASRRCLRKYPHGGDAIRHVRQFLRPRGGNRSGRGGRAGIAASRKGRFHEPRHRSGRLTGTEPNHQHRPRRYTVNYKCQSPKHWSLTLGYGAVFGAWRGVSHGRIRGIPTRQGTRDHRSQ